MNRAADLLNMVVKKVGQDINTVMIGEIESYDSATNTAKIIPLHYVPEQNEEYQPLVNVPIGYFNIGSYSIKVKPKAGDKLLILFADYDIDNILIDGVTKTQNTDRTHSLEDAIALPLSVNFLNNAFNATQDLIISKEGTSAYAKLTHDGNWILNGNSIKLGENASKRVIIENTEGYTTSSKVYAE